MAIIEIRSEEDVLRGWRYRVLFDAAQGPPREHVVFLSWADYEYWSGGRHPPSHVLHRLLELLAERQGERPLPPSFDAAAVRRWFPALDRELPARL